MAGNRVGGRDYRQYMLPIRSKPVTATLPTTTTTTTTSPAVTAPQPPPADEFSTGSGAALRARAAVVLGATPVKGFAGYDIPSPGDVGGWVKDRFDDAVDGFDDLRESIGDTVLDEALGINADRIDSLNEGDRLVIGADIGIKAEIIAGVAAGVTLERTGPDEYTATVDAEVLGGIGLSDTDLTNGATGTAELTFSSKEEALEGLQALGKLNVLGLTVTSDEIETLTSNLSAVQLDSEAAGSLGERVGLDDVTAQGGAIGAAQATGARIEFEDGPPSAVVFAYGQTVEASAVSEALVDQLPIDGDYELTAEYRAELRFALPDVENPFEGDGRLTYAAPEITVHGEVTAAKDGEGAVASVEGTLRPGQLPAFFEALADGNWDDAFGAVAHVEGRARTWRDDPHATDAGVDVIVGSGHFENYTRHFGDDHAFDYGRAS